MTLPDHRLTQVKAPEVDPLRGMDDQALLNLRHAIDLRLKIELSDLNLSEELGLQYRSGKALLDSVQNDKDTPANQRAQVFNSVSMMLEKIVKHQRVVYDAERLKRFEVAFLKVLEKLPLEAKQQFFELYGEYLGGTPV